MVRCGKPNYLDYSWLTKENPEERLCGGAWKCDVCKKIDYRLIRGPYWCYSKTCVNIDVCPICYSKKRTCPICDKKLVPTKEYTHDKSKPKPKIGDFEGGEIVECPRVGLRLWDDDDDF